MKRRKAPRLRKKFLHKYDVVGLQSAAHCLGTTPNQVKDLLARIVK